MMLKSVSSMLAATSLISATAASPALAVRQTGQCSSLHLMVAGGCHQPCSSDSLGLLSSTIAGITSKIANTDLYLVPYDGSAKQAAVSGPLLNQAIAQYTANCPNTPIVLVGYSLGGIITMNTLCGQIPFTSNIIASVAYGEETFAYPQPYDRGTCTANAPLYSRANTAACAAYAPIIRSYCNAEDYNCCSTGNQVDNSAHFTYPGLYDADAAAFVVSQYSSFAGTSSTSSSSSSVSATATSTDTSTTSSTDTSTATSAPLSSTMMSPPPFYPNATVVLSSMAGAPTVSPLSSMPGVIPAAPAPPVHTTAIVSGGRTVTLTITDTTTIPLYKPTGLTTPVNPTETAVPNSAAEEPVISGGATVVPAGTGSGIAIAPSLIPAQTGGASIVPPVGGGPNNAPSMVPTEVPTTPVAGGPVGTGALTASSSLAPFNPNSASSLALPSSLIACALFAMGLLL